MIEQFTPPDAVGRGEDSKPAAVMRIAERLESFVGGSVRIAVEKGREVVRADALPDDVVVFRSIDFEQPCVDAFESDPIATFGETTDLPRTAGRDLAAVVHQNAPAVAQHHKVRRGLAFPRLVELQHDLARIGMMEPPLDSAARSIEQKVVDEQLTPLPDFISRFVAGLDPRHTRRARFIAAFHGQLRVIGIEHADIADVGIDRDSHFPGRCGRGFLADDATPIPGRPVGALILVRNAAAIQIVEIEVDSGSALVSRPQPG